MDRKDPGRLKKRLQSRSCADGQPFPPHRLRASFMRRRHGGEITQQFRELSITIAIISSRNDQAIGGSAITKSRACHPKTEPPGKRATTFRTVVAREPASSRGIVDDRQPSRPPSSPRMPSSRPPPVPRKPSAVPRTPPTRPSIPRPPPEPRLCTTPPGPMMSP